MRDERISGVKAAMAFDKWNGDGIFRPTFLLQNSKYESMLEIELWRKSAEYKVKLMGEILICTWNMTS
jgi:hypothetical protein